MFEGIDTNKIATQMLLMVFASILIFVTFTAIGIALYKYKYGHCADIYNRHDKTGIFSEYNKLHCVAMINGASIN